jgi:methionine aminopeptidase
VAGLAAARARGRNGGRPSKLSPGQVRAAQRLYNEREHTVEQIGSIFGVSRTSIYRALRDFGGHGVGQAMHEAPSVPNEGRAGRGMRLRPGLVIAIEPWFLAGGNDDYRIDSDGWTLRSADGSPGAHVEHTIAITDNGPRILTAHAAA